MSLSPTLKKSVASHTIVSLRTRLFHIYVFFSMFIFSLLAVLARSVPYFSWDLSFIRWLQTIHQPAISFLLDYTSWIGFMPQAIIFLVLALASLWYFGLRWEAVALGLSYGSVTTLVTFLKLLVGRLRPSAVDVQVVTLFTTGSFPSGHVVSYTVLFGFFLFLAYTLLRSSLLRSAIILLCLSTIILIGPSRIYRGEHWPSDVIAAYLLGSVWLLGTIHLYRLGKARLFPTLT